MTKKQKKVLIRIIIAAVLVIALQFIPVKGYVRTVYDSVFCNRI